MDNINSTCLPCGENLHRLGEGNSFGLKIVVLGERCVLGIKTATSLCNDGLSLKLGDCKLLKIHENSRKNYIRLPSSITKYNPAQNWFECRRQNEKEEHLRVVEAAAEIVRADIREQVYCTDKYPLVVKNTGTYHVDLKHVAIAETIVSACRPRSSLSPALLSSGVYIHKNYASRLLMDFLNNLKFPASYNEVQRYEVSLLQNSQPK
ncbi:hypothetical protein PR048_024158 [Dryococelus australis]|uniref:Uncharacterized protein n=1 Tax=Dryococelus australis TaxID=614101 RepID=A0ABQ9GW78_9NEOP|nr:hypothetical protein PR048_024158 [Dryococelus australis]